MAITVRQKTRLPLLYLFFIYLCYNGQLFLVETINFSAALALPAFSSIYLSIFLDVLLLQAAWYGYCYQVLSLRDIWCVESLVLFHMLLKPGGIQVWVITQKQRNKPLQEKKDGQRRGRFIARH